MSAGINTKGAQRKLEKAVKDIKKDMTSETKALAKGIYIAMCNASVKKGKGKTPKAGSKKAENGDWIKGNKLYVVYGRSEKKIPVEDWLHHLTDKSVVQEYYAKGFKRRKRRVAGYQLIKHAHQKKPDELKTHELWRKGSTGKLPNSWGGDGLANYYIRKKWFWELPTPDEAEVKISPTTFRNEDGKYSEANNERVLKLIDEGGTTKGSRHLLGYRLYFTHHGMKHGITGVIPEKIIEDAPMVKIKPFKLKQQVVGRINRVLKKVKPSQISIQHWRQIGKGY